MARRAEARAPVVAGADLWLAEAAIPCRPRHASISRNDLSESLYPDTRRAEEGDTHIATLVERHTRFVMLLKVPSKDTATVVAALGKHVRKLPRELRRSLTWDRGKEMADHKNFTVVYFCDPRSPWQRGSNENTNGLLRQYFPRGTDLSRFSQAYLNRIALRLNQRPRKTLGFETPADRLRAVLQWPVEPAAKSGLMHRNKTTCKGYNNFTRSPHRQ